MNASSISDHARQVLEFAKEESLRWNHEHLGTEHLLLGILKEPDEMTRKILDAFGLSPHQVYREVEKFMQAGPDRIGSRRKTLASRRGPVRRTSIPGKRLGG